MALLKDSIQFASSHNFWQHRADALNTLSFVYLEQGHTEEADALAREVLGLVEPSLVTRGLIADACWVLGISRAEAYPEEAALLIDAGDAERKRSGAFEHQRLTRIREGAVARIALASHDGHGPGRVEARSTPSLEEARSLALHLLERT